MSRDLYTAVGQALSAWEGLEGTLASLFAELCGAVDEGASRAYGVVSSSAGRLDMLKEAFDCYPRRRHESLSTFTDLTKRIRLYGARRNEIAHGIVVLMADTEKPPHGHFLCPATYNSRKRLSRAAIAETQNAFAPETWSPKAVVGNYAYTAAQVSYYRGRFWGLRFEAFDLLTAVQALPKKRVE